MPLTGMRLTAFTDSDQVGGAEISLANLLGALDPGIQISVMGTDEAVVRRIASSRRDASIILVPSISGVRDLRAMQATRRALKADQCDILHLSLSTPWACRYAILAAASIPRIKSVAVEQLVMPLPTRRVCFLKRWSSKTLAAHIAVGRASARDLEEDAGLPRGSIRTIHNGVPIPRNAHDKPPRSRTTQTNPPSNRKQIVTLARLDHVKGLDLLQDALVELPNVYAVVLGEGPERANLEKRAIELGLNERFTLMGWSDDARSILDDADLFVLPSRAEGLPLSICEAMFAELAVVACDVGSVREVVEHGVTGLVVPADDSSALGDAIASLLADESLRRSMGSAGLAVATAEFTAEAMARKYEAIYSQILNSARSAKL
ncbi:MAG: glycosyltransferase family 4 protein [Acidimicrobiia bacterium]|nr:glycosyltransferase family 4 protein [Acidimicrobiia bacterium]MBJ7512836.1 glycosyltransferase family 4 protein [Acidimicrobiia bacterium]